MRENMRCLLLWVCLNSLIVMISLASIPSPKSYNFIPCYASKISMVHLNYHFSSHPSVVRCLGSLVDLALLHIDSKFCGYLKVLQLCHLEIFSASVVVFQVCRLLCFYPVELLHVSLKSILLTWFLRCVIKHYKLL